MPLDRCRHELRRLAVVHAGVPNRSAGFELGTRLLAGLARLGGRARFSRIASPTGHLQGHTPPARAHRPFRRRIRTNPRHVLRRLVVLGDPRLFLSPSARTWRGRFRPTRGGLVVQQPAIRGAADRSISGDDTASSFSGSPAWNSSSICRSCTRQVGVSSRSRRSWWNW